MVALNGSPQICAARPERTHVPVSADFSSFFVSFVVRLSIESNADDSRLFGRIVLKQLPAVIEAALRRMTAIIIAAVFVFEIPYTRCTPTGWHNPYATGTYVRSGFLVGHIVYKTCRLQLLTKGYMRD